MTTVFLAKKELINRAWYAGRCRNARVAQWDERGNCFHYIRYKFGDVFSETIKHPEDDNGFDLFYPEKLIYEEIT